MKKMISKFSQEWLLESHLVFHKKDDRTFFVVLPGVKKDSFKEKVIFKNNKYTVLKILSSKKKTVCYIIRLQSTSESCIHKKGMFYMFLSFSPKPAKEHGIKEVYKDNDFKLFTQSNNHNYSLFIIHSPKANKKNPVIETGASL